MRESKIEKYLCEQVEACGGLCEKHVSPGRVGVPDRLVTWPYGLMDLVETKATGRSVKRGPQSRDHAQRAARGIFVVVANTKEQVDTYVKHRRPGRTE